MYSTFLLLCTDTALYCTALYCTIKSIVRDPLSVRSCGRKSYVASYRQQDAPLHWVKIYLSAIVITMPSSTVDSSPGVWEKVVYRIDTVFPEINAWLK